MPSLDQLKYFEKDCNELGFHWKYNLLNGDNLQKAYSVYQHALKYSFKFMLLLQKLFLPQGLQVSGGANSDLIGVAAKIGQSEVEPNNPFRVFDMLRVTIRVFHPTQIVRSIQTIESSSSFQILKLQNNLDSSLKCVHMNVIYEKGIIGEIIIKYGPASPSYPTHHFLCQLIKAESVP